MRTLICFLLLATPSAAGQMLLAEITVQHSGVSRSPIAEWTYPLSFGDDDPANNPTAFWSLTVSPSSEGQTYLAAREQLAAINAVMALPGPIYLLHELYSGVSGSAFALTWYADGTYLTSGTGLESLMILGPPRPITRMERSIRDVFILENTALQQWEFGATETLRMWVPEPAAWLLIVTGAVLIHVFRLRR